MNNNINPYFLVGLAILIEAAETESVIGKHIKVYDNSYNTRLNSRVNSHQDLYGKEFIIISEPYTKQVHKGLDLRIFGVKYMTMVKVRSPRTGYEYEIMYNENWLVR